ncbi:MAG: HD domain-containing protein [Candidatus Nealsonbacteria bacterium]
MNIVEQVKNFVEEECKKPTSKYGLEPFSCHFVSVVEYATQLANKLEVDKEVVLIASWLHDIGSIMNGREDHHITGSEIAEKKLKELNYPPEKIELVKKCILNHRGSQDSNRESLEEKIVADADAMSNFNNIPGIFKAAFIYENKTQEGAKESVKQKLINKWNKLHFDDSKEIIKPKYEAIMLLLN